MNTTGATPAARSRSAQIRCLTLLAFAACALVIGNSAAITATNTPTTGGDVAISDGTSNWWNDAGRATLDDLDT
jgi:hypothetical protein